MGKCEQRDERRAIFVLFFFNYLALKKLGLRPQMTMTTVQSFIKKRSGILDFNMNTDQIVDMFLSVCILMYL